MKKKSKPKLPAKLVEGIKQARKELVDSEEMALGCRFIAWIFTALGALLTGFGGI